jgi:short-subunit dehydrogenase
MANRPPPQRALVTGASSGIGAALAERLARRGIEVWLAARRKEVLDQRVQRIRDSGGRAHAMALDIAQADATYDTLTRLDEESGGIDLVVANAAIAGNETAVGLDDSSWAQVRDVLHVNLIGSAATVMPFVPRMLRRGHGHIVAISSLAADAPNPRAAAYGASKAGLSFFFDTADIELRPRGVDVTIIHPGFVRTPSLEGLPEKDTLPFIVELEHATDIIDRAIQKRARLVRFPWTMSLVALLPKLLPRFISHPIIRHVTRAPRT